MATVEEFAGTVLEAVFSQMATKQLSQQEIASIARKALSDFKISQKKLPNIANECLSSPGFEFLIDGILPSEVEIVTHLKLLSIFRHIRDEVINRDGLFGIYNSIATGDMSRMFDRVDESRGRAVVKPAQVRWQVYISRAIERYTRWFDSFPKKDFNGKVEFLSNDISAVSEQNLPPIDVLMVWIVHMLHPRFYWEDCVRSGRQSFFLNVEMPWRDIVSFK